MRCGRRTLHQSYVNDECYVNHPVKPRVMIHNYECHGLILINNRPHCRLQHYVMMFLLQSCEMWSKVWFVVCVQHFKSFRLLVYLSLSTEAKPVHRHKSPVEYKQECSNLCSLKRSAVDHYEKHNKRRSYQNAFRQ